MDRNHRCSRSRNNNNSAVILDIQCFKDNDNDYLIKEVCVLEVVSGILLLHHIAKPPFDRDFLTEEKLRESYWLTKRCHGLEWEHGDIPYFVLVDKLRACLNGRSTIYVKGLEKKEYVKRYLVTEPTAATTTTVVDMSDLGCRSLASTTNLLSATVLRCGQHKRGSKSRCALANCSVLRGWLFLTTNTNTTSNDGDGINDAAANFDADVDEIAPGSGYSFASCFCTCPCHLATTTSGSSVSTETIHSTYGIDTVQ